MKTAQRSTRTVQRKTRRRLLKWFDAHKRDLPWRRTKDPYRIWLAEIMLQQTRVPTAVPYYRRFLNVFPTVRKLARARLGSVLRLWAGLGYYSRARNLHATAKRIVREHGGRFPSTLDAALALPGIGPYTARAILSIAYNQPVAVVDGNVARVLVRLFALGAGDNAVRTRTNASSSVRRVRPLGLTLTGRKKGGALAPEVSRRLLQPLADQLVDSRHPGDFNQALMELGSTVCLPRAPHCSACPLEKLCAARQAGVERTLGLRRAKRPRPTTTFSVLVARRNGRLLLVREPAAAGGVFSGLWHFPYLAGATPQRLARQFGAGQPRYSDTFEHEMTARRLVLRVYEAEASGNGRAGSASARWVRPQDIPRLGVGAATRKIAAALEQGSARD